MSNVFISYAKEDASSARMVADALQSSGLSVWWDRHIPPGKTWDDVIGHALDTADCVIVLWSGTSVRSRWVREEAERAASRGCLIPVLIEKVDPPFGFGRIQAAQLSGWRGDAHHPEFADLLAAVSDLAKATTSKSATDQPVEAPVKAVPRHRKIRNKFLWITAVVIAVAVASYVASTSLSRRLSAPQQISPARGTALRDSPPSAALAWKAVPGAHSYSVEHAFIEPGIPCSSAPRDGQTVPNIKVTTYTFQLARSEPGCWRVWAVDERGNEGTKSPWWEFTFALPPPRNWIRIVHKGLYVAKFYLHWEGQERDWQSGTRAIGYEQEVQLPPNVKTVRLNAQEQTGFGWKTIVNLPAAPVQRTYTVSGTTLSPKWTARPPLD
jgi:hypothetical protein